MAAEVQLPGCQVRQFSVFLKNSVGALMRLVKMIEDAQVSVLGCSMHETTDVAVARLVASDPDTVEQIFMERGVPFSVCEVVVVELAEGPAGLGRCLQALLGAEMGIQFAYPLIAHPNGKAAMVLYLDDTAFGRQYLQSVGYRILCQEDISR